MTDGPGLRSIVIPVFRNEETIPGLMDELEGLSEDLAELEVVFVVDGSPDDSLQLLIEELPTRPFRSRVLELSRNFGAFAAVRTGMAAARGRSIAVMAADLQEPTELIQDFFEELDGDQCDIVFGTRTARRDPLFSRVLARTFWAMYRRFVLPEIPRGGVDVFACTRQVADAVLALEGSNSSFVSQLFWVGFRRCYIPYERRERTRGSSSWSFRRRLRYMADSVFAFSDLPILVLLWLGIVGLAFSAILATVTIVGRVFDLIEVPGFTTLVLAIAFLFSILITSQGIIGMYLWRSFENTKRKPTSIVMADRHWDGSGISPATGGHEESEPGQ